MPSPSPSAPPRPRLLRRHGGLRRHPLSALALGSLLALLSACGGGASAADPGADPATGQAAEAADGTQSSAPVSPQPVGSEETADEAATLPVTSSPTGATAPGTTAAGADSASGNTAADAGASTPSPLPAATPSEGGSTAGSGSSPSSGASSTSGSSASTATPAGTDSETAATPEVTPPAAVTPPVVAPAPAAPLTLHASQLALLVAEGDATSEAVAQAYAAARGVPQSMIVRLPVSTTSASLSSADLETLRSRLAERLPAGAQALLVTWSQPSRVQGSCAMSLTSALTFGYDAGWCGVCKTTRASPYYNSSSRQPWTDHGIRPAMMLGTSTLEAAQALIDRGVAAEGRMTQGGRGSGWLMRTSDAARSVRWPDLRSLSQTAVDGITWQYIDNSAGAATNLVSGQSDVMFHFTGLARVAQLDSNRYLPGAVADHLTSYGGRLPDASGQMPVTDWLSAGLTGSYGTVEEPCNYTDKFPRASVLVRHYAAGETLIEAYWKSVRWPGQGLFVGDPLARPWAGR